MDIDKVVEIIRESKRKSKCPPGFKYDKKLKSCVPKKYSGRVYAGYGRFRDEKEDGDDESKKNGKKNGNGNGSSGNGSGHGGNGNGNGGGSNGGNGNGGGNGGGGE